MSRDRRELSIRRILVALDASPHSLAALETAAELAGRLRAELTGLFVEDINLLRVAEFPFARELRYFSTTFRRMELRELEMQLRSQARWMREELARIAERQQIPWSFRVARGAVASEVLSAQAEADLVVMGKVGRSLAGPRRMGSTVRTMIFQSRGFTLILQQGGRIVLPVVAVYDGSELGRKALDVAAHLIEAKDGRLSVYIVADDVDSAQKLKEEALERLRDHRLQVEFRLLINPSLSRLARLVQTEGPGPVVLPCGKGRLQGEAICSLINEVPNPVLLVR